MSKINKINERVEIATNVTEIQKLRREYYKQLNGKKLDNLD